jgi:hypothetical protein
VDESDGQRPAGISKPAQGAEYTPMVIESEILGTKHGTNIPDLPKIFAEANTENLAL